MYTQMRLLFGFLLVGLSTAQRLLDITFTDDASFNVTIAGDQWLTSAPIKAFASGAWQTLRRLSRTDSSGSDVIGDFRCVNVTWISDDDHVLHTSLTSYTGQDIYIFSQQLPSGAIGTNGSNPVLPGGLRVMDPGNYAPVVSFPALSGNRLSTLSYLTWQSRMVNAEWGANVTSGPAGSNEPLITGRGLQGLSTSGPVVLYDEQLNSLVVAPMDNFKSAVHHVRSEAAAPTWDTGVSSEVTELPAGFEHRTMLIAAGGITAALDKWGRAFRLAYNTLRLTDDPNVEYLSYWTDNGAYMSGGAWGEAGGGGSVVNEAAFKQIAQGLQEQQLLSSTKSWQLDDWWYHTSTPQGGVYSACVANWSLPHNTFPSGLKQLSAQLSTPWSLYVPFWCPENVYRDQFRWIKSHNPAQPTLIFAQPHPDDSLRFYQMLFDYGIYNGMRAFEHDYLDYNFLSMPYLRKTYGSANKWLDGMNKAALERNLPIQFCMALPSDLMASVQFDSVTNYRASTDYGINDDRDDTKIQPKDQNINIGAASLLGFALDLRPSKDIFWTHRPENCRGEPKDNPTACGRWSVRGNPGSNCELNSIVATLSTGPVSIADKAGDTNSTIVRRCVRADGRILQPSKPATAVDSTFLQVGSNVRSAPDGDVWATNTALDGMVWHYILSIDVKSAWSMHGADLWPPIPNTANQRMKSSDGGDGWALHPWFTGHLPTSCANGTHAVATRCIIAHVRAAEEIPAIHNTRPIMVQNDTRMFDLTQLAPVVHGWVLLGEVGKYVRVSSDRFDQVSFSASGIDISLSGSDGETIEVTALQPLDTDWLVHVKKITFDKSCNAMLSFVAM